MFWRSISSIAVGLLVTASAVAAPSQYYADESRVAVNGYDVVAYFNHDATRGIPGIEVNYDGFTWYFESQENADRFQADPARYTPAFGGYCAYGVSQGYLVATDPEAWSIVNDKLYLNYNAAIRTRWLSDSEQYIPLAEKHWPRLLSE